MKKHSLALTLAIAMLAGCQAYPGGLASQTAPTIPGLPMAARALEARVAFPAARHVLATEADVKSLATVSLMTTSGATLASGVTNASGAVTLTLGQDTTLVAGTCYVLEAVKGLSANAPGQNAVRLRTIVRWTAEGWTSLTSATAGAAATIDKLTTAVAVTVGLDAAVDPTTLMGIVGAGGTLTAPGAFGTHADTEVLALAESVGAYVAGDLDPIATANGFAPAVTALSATTGEAGSLLTITGTGFNPLPNQTTVTIGGLAATVIATTTTKVYCVVPALTAGAQNVVVGGADGGTFTVTDTQTTALPIAAANKDSGGVWATGSLTRDLTGYPDGGTGVNNSVSVTSNGLTFPSSGNYTSYTVADGITTQNTSTTCDVYVQGDLTLGAGSNINTNGSTGAYGVPGGAGGNITLHVGGNLIMGANSAITSNGGMGEGGGATSAGGNGGAVTVYAHGFSLDPSAKIEAQGGLGTSGGANGSNGSVSLHYGSGSQPSASFIPTPTFTVIAAATTAQEAVSTAYDIGSSHDAVTYRAFSKSETKPSGTNITYQFADSADGTTTWGDWTTDITTLTKRYIRFKATMTTTDATVTPALTGISVQYVYP